MEMNRRKFLKFAQGLLAAAGMPAKAFEAAPVVSVVKEITQKERHGLYTFVETFGANLSQVLQNKAYCEGADLVNRGVDYALQPLSYALSNLNVQMFDLPAFYMDDKYINITPFATHPNLDQIIDKVVDEYFKTIPNQAGIFMANHDVSFANAILGIDEPDTISAFKKAIKLSLKNGKSYMRDICEIYGHTAKEAFVKSEYTRQLELHQEEVLKQPKLTTEETEELIEHICRCYHISINIRPNQPCVFFLKSREKTPEGKVQELTDIITRFYPEDSYVELEGKNARIDVKPGSYLHGIMEKARAEIAVFEASRYMQDADMFQRNNGIRKPVTDESREFGDRKWLEYCYSRSKPAETHR